MCSSFFLFYFLVFNIGTLCWVDFCEGPMSYICFLHKSFISRLNQNHFNYLWNKVQPPDDIRNVKTTRASLCLTVHIYTPTGPAVNVGLYMAVSDLMKPIPTLFCTSGSLLVLATWLNGISESCRHRNAFLYWLKQQALNHSPNEIFPGFWWSASSTAIAQEACLHWALARDQGELSSAA